MTMDMLTWLIAVPLLGFATGLRTMTPMAVLCWFSYLGYLPVHHSWAIWTTKLVTAIVFTVLAIGEYIGDKLPKTPSRVSPAPLMARIFFSGLVGAVAASGLKGSESEGVILAVLGGLIGAFGGYLSRRDLVQHLQCKDWYVAVLEDVIAVSCAVFAMGIITG